MPADHTLHHEHEIRQCTPEAAGTAAAEAYGAADVFGTGAALLLNNRVNEAPLSTALTPMTAADTAPPLNTVRTACTEAV